MSTASKLLRVCRQRVYQLIEEGRIVGRKHDSTWLINLRSIEQRAAFLEAEDAKFERI